MSINVTQNPAVREERRQRVLSLYKAGLNQVEMAAREGVSRQQIAHDLKTLFRRWHTNSNEAIEKRKVRELARIDHLETEAWEGFERSMKNRESVTDSVDDHVVRTEGQYGDPRFLNIVQWCIEQRCKIFGMYAPVNNRHEIYDFRGANLEELKQRAANVLRRNGITVDFERAGEVREIASLEE